MNNKQISLIVVALLLSVALGVLASTVGAQEPPLPPDAEWQTIGGVSPVSPIVPDIPGIVPVSPTPEPTAAPMCVGLASGWVLCYEW